MAQLIDTSESQIAFDMVLQTDPRQFYETFIPIMIFHEHSLEGVILERSDLSRALDKLPVRNDAERTLHRAIYNMHHTILLILESFAPSLLHLQEMYDTEPGPALQREPLPSLPDDALKGESPISRSLLDFLFQLYTCEDELVLAPKQRITYRTRTSSPGVYNLPIEDPSAIATGLEELFAAYERDRQVLHPIEVGAKLHWSYMRLFPYEEETPIVGRLLLNAHLLWSKLPPVLFINRERASYMDAITSATEGALIDQILKGIEQTATLSKRILSIE